MSSGMMWKKTLAVGIVSAAILGLAAIPAEARGYVGFGFNFGGPVWGGPAYYPGYYYAPPPVVYTPPAYYYATPATTVPATTIYQTTDGRLCKPYQGTIIVNGVTQTTNGTACQGADGVWRVVN